MCLSTLATTSPEGVAAAVPEGTALVSALRVRRPRGQPGARRRAPPRTASRRWWSPSTCPVLGVRERELRRPPSPADGPSAPRPASAADRRAARRAGRLPTCAGLTSSGSPPRARCRSCVKGILTAEDARRAVEHGVAGVIVSNHGGRQLDTVLSGADALPAIVDEVGDQIDVLVDGGIRRGTDVVKALALGARAVLIGRPVVCRPGRRRRRRRAAGDRDPARRVRQRAGTVGRPGAAELDRSFVTARAVGGDAVNVLVTGITGYIGSAARARAAARRPHRPGLRPSPATGSRSTCRCVAGDAIIGARAGARAGRRRGRLLPDPLDGARRRRRPSPPASAPPPSASSAAPRRRGAADRLPRRPGPRGGPALGHLASRLAVEEILLGALPTRSPCAPRS